MKTKLLFICSGLIISTSSFILGRMIERKKTKKHGTLNIIHYDDKGPDIMLFLDKKGVDDIKDMAKEKFVTFSIQNTIAKSNDKLDA